MSLLLKATVSFISVWALGLDASEWKFTTGEEDWGETFYASTENTKGETVSIFSSKEAFNPALLISPYKESYGKDFLVEIDVDGKHRFRLSGSSPEYFQEIYVAGLGKRELAAITGGRTLSVIVAGRDTLTFNLTGCVQALRPIIELPIKNDSQAIASSSTPDVPDDRDPEGYIELVSIQGGGIDGEGFIFFGLRNLGKQPIRAFRANIFKVNDFDEEEKILQLEFSSESRFFKNGEMTTRHIIRPDQTIYFSVESRRGITQTMFLDGVGKDIPNFDGRFKLEVLRVVIAEDP
jgi:hypothetical protein